MRRQKGEVILVTLFAVPFLISVALATVAGVGAMIVSDHYSGKPGIYCPNDGVSRPDCK